MKIYSARLKFILTFIVSFCILSIPIGDKHLFNEIHKVLPSVFEKSRDYAKATVQKVEEIQKKRDSEMIETKEFKRIPAKDYESIQALKKKLKNTPPPNIKKAEEALNINFDSYDFRE